MFYPFPVLCATHSSFSAPPTLPVLRHSLSLLCATHSSYSSLPTLPSLRHPLPLISIRSTLSKCVMGSSYTDAIRASSVQKCLSQSEDENHIHTRAEEKRGSFLAPSLQMWHEVVGRLGFGLLFSPPLCSHQFCIRFTSPLGLLLFLRFICQVIHQSNVNPAYEGSLSSSVAIF